jgi:hypothetical protein
MKTAKLTKINDGKEDDMPKLPEPVGQDDATHATSGTRLRFASPRLISWNNR